MKETEHCGTIKQILIVDDHAIMREGIREIINKELGLKVCAEASNPAQTLEAIEQHAVDLVLLDLSLGSGSGLDLLKDIRRQWPSLPVLVLSMHDESVYAERVLRSGGQAYVMKESPSSEIIRGIRQVLSGRPFFSRAILEKAAMRSSRLFTGAGDPMEQLSDREMEVFRLLGQGYRAQEIADRLNLSIKTIESYFSRIKQKLNLSSASEILQKAIAWCREEDLSD